MPNGMPDPLGSIQAIILEFHEHVSVVDHGELTLKLPKGFFRPGHIDELGCIDSPSQWIGFAYVHGRFLLSHTVAITEMSLGRDGLSLDQNVNFEDGESRMTIHGMVSLSRDDARRLILFMIERFSGERLTLNYGEDV